MTGAKLALLIQLGGQQGWENFRTPTGMQIDNSKHTKNRLRTVRTVFPKFSKVGKANGYKGILALIFCVFVFKYLQIENFKTLNCE